MGGEDRGDLNYTAVTSAKIITHLVTASSSSRYRALRGLMHRGGPRTNQAGRKAECMERDGGGRATTRGGRPSPTLSNSTSPPVGTLLATEK